MGLSAPALARQIYGVERTYQWQDQAVRRVVAHCAAAVGMASPGAGHDYDLEPDFVRYVLLVMAVDDDMPAYGRKTRLTCAHIAEFALCCLGKPSGSGFVMAFDGPHVRAYCLDDIALVRSAWLESTTALKVVKIP